MSRTLSLLSSMITRKRNIVLTSSIISTMQCSTKRSYTSSSILSFNNNSNNIISSSNNSFWDITAIDPINDIVLHPPVLSNNTHNHNITWHSHSDKEYGGSSISKVSSITNNSNSNSNSNSSSNSNSNNILLFQGNINYQQIIAKNDIKSTIKGSFCAITGKLDKRIDLRDYEGFEIELESMDNDLIIYFNTKYQTFIEDDLYQVEIHLKKNKKKIFHIPFHKFRLMGKGAEKEYQRINDSLILESIGFMTMLKEENNFDFSLQISKIKAIHVINDRLLQHTLFVNKLL